MVITWKKAVSSEKEFCIFAGANGRKLCVKGLTADAFCRIPGRGNKDGGNGKVAVN